MKLTSRGRRYQGRQTDNSRKIGTVVDLVGASLTNACTRQSRLSHLVLAHKLRQPRLQVKPALGIGGEMRRNTFVLATTIIVCLFAAVGSAGPWDNLIHLASPNHHYVWCLEGADGNVHTVAVYLDDPVNPAFAGSGSRPVAFVNGFECKLGLSPTLQLVGVRYPVPAINVGTGNSLVVGYSEPIPVASADEGTILALIDYVYVGDSGVATAGELPVLALSPGPCDGAIAYMGLAPADRPSIAGAVAYLDAEDSDDPIVVAITTDAGFYVLPTSVPNTSSSWGGVKSLYR